MTAAYQLPPSEVTKSMPFEKYVDLPLVHATALHDILVSPLLYYRRRDMPRQDTDGLRIGRASHTAILEPDRFLLEYALWPAKNGRRFGKKWDAFKVANEGRTILTEAQYKTALRLRDAARSHPISRRYLHEKGQAELTIAWTHPRTGLRCKSRLDWVCSVLGDVKSTRNPAPAKFSSDAARYGYAMQLAFYADALATLGETPPVKIFAVQNVEPYDVVVYDVPNEVMQVGREQYEMALDRVIECTESGEWPGLAYAEEVRLNLPAWATQEVEEQLTMDGESLF